MEFSYDDNELQEIIKLNGQVVCNALATLKNNATEIEISDHISNYTGQPIYRVAREVNEILHYAVSNGFLVKSGNNYTLPCQRDIYHLDCDNPDSSSDSVSDGASGVDTVEEGSEAACVPVAEAERPEITDEEINELTDWIDGPDFDNDVDFVVAVLVSAKVQNNEVSSSSSEDGDSANDDAAHGPECG